MRLNGNNSLRRLSSTLLMAVLALAACSSDEKRADNPAGRGAINLRDSLQLNVPDSAALGTFSYITAEPSGGVLVSDAGRGRLLRYDAQGQLRQVIGRYGGGPGEFQGTSVVRPLQDGSVLAVMDPKRQYMSFLSSASGEFLGGLLMPFREPGQTWTVSGQAAVFGVEAAPFLFGKLNLRDSSFTPLGETPAQYLENLFLYLTYGRVEVIPDGARYLAMIPIAQGIQVLDSLGAFVGMVDVPARDRRGKPADLLARQAEVTGPRRLVGSVDGAFARLRDGNIAILNMDVTFADAMPPMPSDIKYYISVLSEDLSKACIDLRVPHDPTVMGPWPVFAQGDLILTAEHVEGDTVRTVVYRYAVDTDGCEWVETGGVRPSPLAGLAPAPTAP